LAETDTQLINSARDGDHVAFKQIVLRYESLVASTVIGMLGKCQEAEDIGQETFIRFYKSLNKFRGESGVGTYLTRIAINLSLNELKRRKRKFRLFSPITEKEEESIGAEDGHYNRREAHEIVHAAVRKLQPDFRSVIVLRLISGYSPEEAAEILGVPVGTVFSRLARAQKKLAAYLEPHKGEF